MNDFELTVPDLYHYSDFYSDQLMSKTHICDLFWIVKSVEMIFFY